MTLEKQSPCKVNLLLNILGKRPDGFHELETLMHPVNLFDELNFAKTTAGIQLRCSDPALPTDNSNLVYRAASTFLTALNIKDGVEIDLKKNIPMAAGLGGGSGNAATTLLGLNELFGNPATPQQLHQMATSLGSDIPFFLQSGPALATGRGENIQSLKPFSSLNGLCFFLIHPGFGISTPWAYRELARFPSALNGKPGRAAALAQKLQSSNIEDAGREFYNSLEAPALEKYPVLVLFQEFLNSNGAIVSLMSGSGSTTFALFREVNHARDVSEKFKAKFGPAWTAVLPV